MRTYCKEKLQKALYRLTIHPGTMKERLLYVQDHLETANMAMPAELREDWGMIWKELVKYTSNYESKRMATDDFVITVKRRKNKTLGQIVEKIYLFYSEHFE